MGALRHEQNLSQEMATIEFPRKEDIRTNRRRGISSCSVNARQKGIPPQARLDFLREPKMDLPARV